MSTWGLNLTKKSKIRVAEAKLWVKSYVEWQKPNLDMEFLGLALNKFIKNILKTDLVILTSNRDSLRAF